MSEERSAEDAKAGSPDPSPETSTEASTEGSKEGSKESTPESTSDAAALPSAADGLAAESESAESNSAEPQPDEAKSAESQGESATADAPVQSKSESGPAESAKPKSIRTVVGQVVSDKMQKTVTVLVERKVKHPLYKKYIRRSTKMHAHDESETCRIGDRISIVQCRPISKTKSWKVHEIIRRSK